jgi:hypothetical protein
LNRTADFEEILNSLTHRLKCLVCSSDIRLVDLIPTSVSKHRNSPKHVAALRARTAPAPIGLTLLPAPIPDNLPLVPAVMTYIESYGDGSVDFDEEMPLVRPGRILLCNWKMSDELAIPRAYLVVKTPITRSESTKYS